MKSQIPLSHVRVDIYFLVSPPDQRYIPILNTCTLYWPDGSHIGRRFGPQDKNGPSWMQWPSCSAVDPLFWKLPALVTQLNFLKFIHPADWLRLARTRTRPHEWRRAARRFEGHDIGYFYPGLGADGILRQITRPSLRNLHQTFFRATGIRREMNKTRYIYNLPRQRPPSSFSSLLVGIFPHHLMETIFTSFYSQHCYCEFSTRSLSRMWVSRWWDKCRYGRCFVSALADW